MHIICACFSICNSIIAGALRVATTNNQIIQNENAASEEKVVKKTEQKKESANHSQNSVLRVDAKRVDNLLNLVSEAVIVKATFNQLALQFTNNASSFQNSEIEFKDKLHSLFDKLPSYLERMQEGVSANEIKKETKHKKVHIESEKCVGARSMVLSSPYLAGSNEI